MIDRLFILAAILVAHYKEDPKTFIAEWSGCVFGLGGSLLLATNTWYSRYGWMGYFVANVALIIFARRVRAYGLLVQQVGFIGVTVFGLYRCFDRHEVVRLLEQLLA